MALFDQLYVSLDKLPITEKERKILGNNKYFFVEDLEPYGNDIYITDAGRLEKHDWQLAKEKRSKDYREDLNFHGILYFYAYVVLKRKKSVNMDFFAKFTDGNLVEITRSTPHYHCKAPHIFNQ